MAQQKSAGNEPFFLMIQQLAVSLKEVGWSHCTSSDHKQLWFCD